MSMFDAFTRRHVIFTYAAASPTGVASSYRVTCAEASRRLEAATQLEKSHVELQEAHANLERLVGNAMRIAFNAGRQVASLLQVDMFNAVPVLGADGRSVTVEFETLTLTVSPFVELITVAIRDTAEAQHFAVRDGIISRKDQDVILGMLERSRRDDKTLSDTLALSGEPVAV